jgi:REP element-mobilizing transposase RayT
MPGVIFHITARIQGREPLLAGSEPAVASLILKCAAPAGAAVLAWAVMPNHLHVVVRQGGRPLSWFMQPLLRRMALLLNRRFGRQGHVFERRFFAAPCLDADYARTAIVYVHLNPVRAGLCNQPGGYPWTSHHAYVPTASTGNPSPAPQGLEDGIRLFATSFRQSFVACRADYEAFLRWRQAEDRAAGHDDPGLMQLLRDRRPAPRCVGGDRYWQHHFMAASTLASAGAASPSAPRREELSGIAARTLNELAPGLTLDVLRLGFRSRPMVAARDAIIRRALRAGHQPPRIARFLRVSGSTVSRIAVAVRQAALPAVVRAELEAAALSRPTTPAA